MSRTVDQIPAWLAGVYEVRPGYSCQGLHGQVDAGRAQQAYQVPDSGQDTNKEYCKGAFKYYAILFWPILTSPL